MIAVVTVALGGILDDPAYRFCHEPLPAPPPELCALLPRAPAGTCPGLKAACEDPRPRSSGCAGEEEERTDSSEDPPLLSDLPSLGLGLDVEGLPTLLAVGVALLVLLFAAGAWRYVRLRPAPRLRPPPDTGRAEPLHGSAAPVPERPAGELLAEAWRAFERGALEEATVLGRGAALRTLAERGLIQVHRSRTDREYLRELRGEEQRDLRVVVEVAERQRWGRERPTTARVERALRAVGRLVTVVAVFLAVGEARGADRYGPRGDRAFYDLVRDELGEDGVRLHRGRVERVDADVRTLLVDRTAVELDEAAWEELLAWVTGGGLLIVVGEVESWGLGPIENRCDGPIPAPVWEGTLGYRQPLEGAMLLCGDLALVTQEARGMGLIVGVAEPALLWNGAMVVPANERFWRDLIGLLVEEGWLGTPMELATWSSVDGPTPSGALANLHLLPFALHVLVLWTVVALARGWRFVAPRDDRANDALPFVRHLEALGERYRQLGDHAHAARVQVQWWAATRGLRELVRALREQAGLSAPVASALLERVERGEPVDDEELAHVAAVLDRLATSGIDG